MALFRYASSRTPCVICGATSDCRESHDGLCFCHTNRSCYDNVPGYFFVGEAKGGTWGMWVSEDSDRQPRREYTIGGTSRPGRPQADPNAPCKFRAIHRASFPLYDADARKLASSLGLPLAAARQFKGYFGQRWDSSPSDVMAYAIPEYGFDADGVFREVSYLLRYADGTKRNHGDPCCPVKRGLTMLDGWDTFDGPVYLPEGASDTATLWAMGIPALGRPSNVGGADAAARLLAMHEATRGRDIVVLGENDKKQNGSWPGREGAFSVAEAMAKQLDRPIRVAMAPDGYKDVREWFKAKWKPGTDPKALREQFLREMVFRVVRPDSPPEPVHQAAAEQPQDAEGAAQQMAYWREHLAGIIQQREQEQAAAEAIRGARADRDAFPCDAPRCVVLLHRTTHTPVRQSVRCQKAGCCGCRSWLIYRERASAAAHWAAAGQLYELGCDPEQWGAVQRRIRRAGGEYMRVRDGAGWWIVTNVRIAGAIPVTMATATGCLATLLEDWSDKRPVSTSHGWSLPDLAGESEYERIGAASSIAEMDRVAEKYGASVKVSGPGTGTGRVVRSWRLVKEWTAEEGRAAAEEMASREEREWGDWLPPGPVRERMVTLAEDLALLAG